jgi:single-stranded-DNA-specific exonuclease
LGPETVETLWRVRECDAVAVRELAAALSVSPVMGALLLNRGHSDVEDAKRFLRPSLDHLIDPDELDGVNAAVERISRAVAENEKILVYGDYDVDGMTSAALLYHFFKLISARAEFFLPRRMEEGYGLNAARLRQFRSEGVDLLITVDCGISAIEEARLARELGIDLVITDHHESEGELPDAVAVINPKRPGSRYPYRGLAGVGVAFKLAWALSRHFSGQKKVTTEFRDFLLNAVGLVALGTVADVVPLTDENRALVSAGLSALANSRLPGIRALMNVVGITDGLSARDIAFRLAPRLNAAGRLNEPAAGFELLTTGSFGRALEIARDLDSKNRKRQGIERKILASAQKMLGEFPHPYDRRVILLADSDWHSGVLGIVASRLAEKYYRPTLLLSIDGDVAKGSARSIPPFHLFDALKSCEDVLENYGGHAQAAGVTVRAERIDELRDALDAAAGGLTGEDMVPAMTMDAEVSLAEVTPSLVKELQLLEPFGERNPVPLFVSRSVEVAGRPRRLGADGQHLSFFVRDGSKSMRAIAFGMGELSKSLENHQRTISVVFEPQVDTWRGTGEIELVVRDIRLD